MRVAIVVQGRLHGRGLWAGVRSEGRVALNWAALLAAHGYEVILSPEFAPIEAELCPIPGVVYTSAESYENVDWLLYATTSPAPFSLAVRARHTVRIQWPTSRPIAVGNEIFATVHAAHIAQIREETGCRECLVLPHPVLPLSWWREQAGLADEAMQASRVGVLWAARAAFGGAHGTTETWGDPILTVLEELLRPRSMYLTVLEGDEYLPECGPLLRQFRVAERFSKMSAVMEPPLLHGDVLNLMRRSRVVALTSTNYGAVVPETLFEGAAPMIWDRFGHMYPELAEAAARHNFLFRRSDSLEDARARLVRLFDDDAAREAFVAACKIACASHTPEASMTAWRLMEERYG